MHWQRRKSLWSLRLIASAEGLRPETRLDTSQILTPSGRGGLTSCCELPDLLRGEPPAMGAERIAQPSVEPRMMGLMKPPPAA
eukprot:1741027-Pyramimonas_sp.AAC.1